MKEAFNILLLVLNIINIVLHGIGIYLLYCLYNRCTHRIQQIYLINLSVTECILNVLEALKLLRLLVPISDKTGKTLDLIIPYVIMMQFTGISLVFYFAMIYITLDRFLEIVLNIKYPLYWNKYKAKYLLIFTWVVGAVSGIIVCLANTYTGFQWEGLFFKYVYPTIELSFVILAVMTYSFIFHKYRRCKNIPTPSINKRNVIQFQRPSLLLVFRQSRFYVSVLLVISFLLFMVAADLIYLFAAIVYGINSDILLTSCLISYAISNFS